MPKVVTRERTSSFVETREETIPWRDLTHSQTADILRPWAKTMIAGSIAVASFLFVESVTGDGGQQLSLDDAAETARAQAKAVYDDKSLREKFEAAYVTPIEIKDDFRVNESGVRGKWAHMWTANTAISFGQTCLRGSAYDTTPSEIRGWTNGDISAVASLSSNAADEVYVYPAGSDAPSLRFSVSGGELIPDVKTERTLTANGCELNGLPVTENSYEDFQTLHTPLQPGR